MKLPKFFRSLMYASIPVFLVSMVIFIIVIGMTGEGQPNFWETVSYFVGGVMILSFITMTGSIILEPLVRASENALLRRLGKSTTATVMDFYYIDSGTNKGRKIIEAIRIKLEVHDPDGGTFIGVAEDSPQMGLRIVNGQTVPVKFDPRTHEVALDLPGRQKANPRKDF